MQVWRGVKGEDEGASRWLLEGKTNSLINREGLISHLVFCGIFGCLNLRVEALVLVVVVVFLLDPAQDGVGVLLERGWGWHFDACVAVLVAQVFRGILLIVRVEDDRFRSVVY